FYDADTCLVIVRNRSEAHYQLRRVDRKSPELQASPEKITEDIARLLLGPSPAHALIHRRKKDFLYSVGTTEMSKCDVVDSSALTNILGSKTFISVPICYRSQSIGRVYIIGGTRRFNDSDVDFILQLIDHATPLLDNIRLVDHLALDAADQERQKIARDIHDSVIQPYIGLQLGLAAICQRLETGSMNVTNDIKQLLELTNKEIVDLRRYVRGLKSDEHNQNALLPALRRFATKFSVATGIEVEVKEIGNVRINDRLSAEVFQMVTEGLSNVRRHTHAHRAEVKITSHLGNLVLQIINETVNGLGASSFQPWSIAERAEALGGQISVSQDESNRTVLSIEIPL
ncbi:MAG TPA: histidine kinase, partial [Pyrinomonadaceae bacterium]|nr:histidine kinase [Pyrinomonadaceae bacterium]